ncbi:hypothetical protein [Thiomicrorhabdus sp. Milos-T2]|uniref:hypothetical protein n=1 Tax=Thiomicrorhabdus sp. Milos-T2 TaxID=90814 RepID=UPI00049432AB|nr:hypothetical protein [Thiomicrorhabdus sp. Milos-T2]
MKLAHKKHAQKFSLVGLFIGILFIPLNALAAGLMPFVLGNATAETSVSTASVKVKQALKDNGFNIAGTYSPTQNATIIVVTNNQLKKIASLSKHGGFGAMQRVAVTKTGGKIEVSYTNPSYLWNIYRMKGDISPIQTAMQKALGKQSEFGADKGLSADDLRGYHYKMMMPYFDDEDELAEYGSYKEAVASVEAGLKAKQAGSKKVYRIDIPGKNVTVFGVALNYKGASDKNIAKQIDLSGHSHAAHFPYEILVDGDEVMALNGKFRIAINWPSLSMMGSGSFMSISDAPDDIKDALTAVANNKKIESEEDSLL